jgi:hypothetical protein
MEQFNNTVDLVIIVCGVIFCVVSIGETLKECAKMKYWAQNAAATKEYGEKK